jgi:hypothetical protein
MEYFTYENDLRLLCCKLCKHMVTRHRIQAHLRGKPHGLVKNEIEKVKLGLKRSILSTATMRSWPCHISRITVCQYSHSARPKVEGFDAHLPRTVGQ